MTDSDPTDIPSLEEALEGVQGLTWLPWVGANYGKLPKSRRVLIVGESHYSDKEDPEDAVKDIADYMADPLSTRKQVEQTMIADDWDKTPPTLANLHNLLYNPKNREAFWADLCYYNFVQRPMRYRQDSPERPTKKDFREGWEVFIDVIKILKPDHVLFVGVEASNQFNSLMAEWGVSHTPIEALDWINRTNTRRASIELDGHNVMIHSIRHCGSYFSTDRWHDYLVKHAAPMMSSLAASAGVEPPKPPAKRLHVLGMAKSSLDLRGAKAPKLELDFLRLAFAVNELREAGEEAVGYLLVLVPKVAKTAEGWRDKYGTGNGVVILCEELEGDNLESLIKEKADNAIGFIQANRFEDAEYELSLADLGKKLGESALHNAIKTNHPECTPSTDYPHSINWDYYGTLPMEG